MNSKRNLLGILLALTVGLFCLAPAAQAQESESDLSAIREMWEGQPLTVKISGNRAAGLADFARTFARAYPSDLTDAIVARLNDPNNTRKDPNTFVFDPPHGYLKYRYAMDGGAWLGLCYRALPTGGRPALERAPPGRLGDGGLMPPSASTRQERQCHSE